MPNDFHREMQTERAKRLRELQSQLPPVCADYFMAVEQVTSPLTRLSYARDLGIFFQYLCEEVPAFRGKTPREVTPEDIGKVTKKDLERYGRYLSYYVKNEETENPDAPVTREVTNNEYGIKRKFASLRSFYKYLYSEGLIPGNTAELVSLPKLHERAIIRLEVDEVARILDEAETGRDLPKSSKRFHNATGKRDLALLSLFLGTGIRISECVGLNIDDFDFEQNAFVVTRKGGKDVILYLSDEVADALKDYLEERRQIEAQPGHEEAFFLSLQRRRITQRAVENMVKKYAAVAAPLKKKISPHKLRSTFGTNLYRETGDIYLVADVLGHSDVNTTRRHYAAIAEDNRRIAAQKTVLRDDPQP